MKLYNYEDHSLDEDGKTIKQNDITYSFEVIGLIEIFWFERNGLDWRFVFTAIPIQEEIIYNI